jgi:Fis family transcriptional regulator
MRVVSAPNSPDIPCHACGLWPETVSRSNRAVTQKTRGKSPAKKHVPARNGATVVRVRNRPLRDLTEEALQSYFSELNGHRPGDLYELVLGEIETPLLKTVLDYTGGNQSVAAEILGINRATLRKKLRQYELLD